MVFLNVVQIGNCRLNVTNLSALQEVVKMVCPENPPLLCDGTSVEVGTMDPNSCCVGCSCDEECGLYGNCCYEDDDTYQLGEKRILKCIATDSDYFDYSAAKYMHKFIVATPKDGCRAPGSCYYPDVLTPWQNFNPVFSKAKRMNYITEECAKCHGVTDEVLWKSVLVFDKFKVMNLEHVIDMLFNRTLVGVHVSFIHPGTNADKRSTTCATVLKENTCTHPIVSELEGLNITYQSASQISTDLNTACLMGPKSPFYLGAFLYRNVYCSLCGRGYKSNEMCSDGGYKFNGQSFSTLMTSEFVNRMKADARSKISMKTPVACKGYLESSCRPLLCPTIQLRTDTGECSFTSNRWFLPTISINLKLTSIVPDTEKINLQNLSQTDVLKAFKKDSPWDKCWSIVNVGLLSSRLEVDSLINLIVTMVCDSSLRDPVSLKDSIQTDLGKPWVFKVGHVSLSLTQDFSEHGDIQKDKGRFLEPSWYSRLNWKSNLNISENITALLFEMNIKPPTWEILFQSDIGNPKLLMINKLWFCSQVKLQPTEYVYTDVVGLLKVEFEKEILYPAKYVDTRIAIHVCVEDTDLDVHTNSGSIVYMYLPDILATAWFLMFVM